MKSRGRFRPPPLVRACALLQLGLGQARQRRAPTVDAAQNPARMQAAIALLAQVLPRDIDQATLAMRDLGGVQRKPGARRRDITDPGQSVQPS